MSRVWLFQDSRQNVDGLKRSKKVGSKSLAQKEARKLEGQLAIGNFDMPGNKVGRIFDRTTSQQSLAISRLGMQNRIKRRWIILSGSANPKK